MHFGAQSRGLRAPCERFAPWVSPGPRPRITRFRLAADLGRMGLVTHRVSNKVSKITSRHLVPLDRAFPAHALLHEELLWVAACPTLLRTLRRSHTTRRFALGLERVDARLDLLVTALDRLVVAVVHLELLAQHEEVFIAIVTRERGGDLGFRRLAPGVAMTSEHCGIGHAGHNVAQDQMVWILHGDNNLQGFEVVKGCLHWLR